MCLCPPHPVNSIPTLNSPESPVEVRSRLQGPLTPPAGNARLATVLESPSSSVGDRGDDAILVRPSMSCVYALVSEGGGDYLFLTSHNSVSIEP